VIDLSFRICFDFDAVTETFGADDVRIAKRDECAPEDDDRGSLIHGRQFDRRRSR
jgi:hypothetical protein